MKFGHWRIAPGVGDALFAALAFGATTPFSKRIGSSVNPQIFAGLLYLGSGAIIGASLVFVPSKGKESSLQKSDLWSLSGAVVFGGIIAPVLLLIGLKETSAASASLLLNLEAVFTALGAWFIAKEHASTQVIAGMLAIVAGGLLLSLDPQGNFVVAAGSLGIVGACACWGVDNVLTRPLSLRDARQVASVKGVVAGSLNLLVGLLLGGKFPSFAITLGTLTIGFLGYGLSLVFAVKAMRVLGTARTGAYYGAAPFVGAVVAIVWLRESVGHYFVPASLLMGFGLFLHVAEVHKHTHLHQKLSHEHAHQADIHHSHSHDAGDHALRHVHDQMSHSHDHTPDDHHRHRHPEEGSGRVPRSTGE
jgi:drug/metabolite transporter (DMT)-like permease